jgi:phosphoserine phosphatase SerB
MFELLAENAPSQQSIFRELLLVSKQIGVTIDFSLLTEPSPQLPSDHARPASEQYVITAIAADSITPSFLVDLGYKLQERQFVLESVNKLSQHRLGCIELVVSSPASSSVSDIQEFRSEMFVIGRKYSTDVAVQKENLTRKSKRLVVMDMDSTLIQQEVIDEIARYAGKFEAVQEITHRAMAGELDFKRSLYKRVECLKGTPASVFQQVIDNLVYTPGAHLLVKTLKRLGYKLAVISGGFTPIAQHVRQTLGLDYAYANQLEIGPDGCFTGRTLGPIVDAQRKADLLTAIAQQEQVDLEQTICIGDGANDLPMLSIAGLGIAFNAKPAVQERAAFRLNRQGLDSVLYFLGIPEAEQIQLRGNDVTNQARPRHEEEHLWRALRQS